MENLSALMARLPTRELEVRRLCVRDEDFRRTCEDYEVAAKALRHWECVEKNPDRAVEYRQIADEIEVEIVTHLDAASAAKMMRLDTTYST